MLFISLASLCVPTTCVLSNIAPVDFCFPCAPARRALRCRKSGSLLPHKIAPASKTCSSSHLPRHSTPDCSCPDCGPHTHLPCCVEPIAASTNKTSNVAFLDHTRVFRTFLRYTIRRCTFLGSSVHGSWVHLDPLAVPSSAGHTPSAASLTAGLVAISETRPTSRTFLALAVSIVPSC